MIPTGHKLLRQDLNDEGPESPTVPGPDGDCQILSEGNGPETDYHPTWEKKAQQNIARQRVSIVGLESVECIVAEALARIG